ncbi:TlyA family RNA methyltransferase [Campylobacter sp. RM9344]|uniref:TlyA family RNA methyltransferase n=1 Tax=Campylobacter californiensis TaxID=1032243 RepID=A0AAW3ZWP2_9BACT|nr:MULTISPECIES: TlyA family RNA methyltransferase [unclassified Campylobacter]MBE2984784.1 TlyA family RNA methyltransferase [Campylobacter sp. RM6883]MBE2994750.1 TlyA family RNA methyltransferase [Campylobacter sp. RM6913]MBE3029616.1 TlyA family RNA methyltransferase [Campylobacter sp. RM9344]MBE3608308.1 TlyA family RNA methyltransferase [Campylobacter sp. RM9337]QCD50559.1 16S/23S rRNA (cytidine-2'-O)-methyltransferase [Campylobacter sp. RM6914]
MRFDLYVAQELNISRNKASELIKNGKIALNDEICDKVSLDVQGGKVGLLDEIYVGRGALKLKSYLKSKKIEIYGKNALDIGSSTGGFMQILLANGVKSVTGVDVGSDQLDTCLRKDERVKIYENTDVRLFKSSDKFELITCDVSFISVVEILEAIDKNADRNAMIIILFKPQFEVGKDVKRNKKGVVTDKNAVLLAMKKFELACAKFGWTLLDTMECDIKGKEGNAEFFYTFNKR